jgi:hypothetical protein
MEFVDGGDQACGSFIMDIYKNRLDGKYLHMNGSVMDEFTILKSNLEVQVPDVFICEGEDVLVNPIVSGGSDSLVYQWTINNQVATSISVGTQNYGTHNLTVADSVTGQIVTRTFNVSQGNAMQIQQSNDTLYASGSTNYQWYLNGDLIVGANNSFYVPTVSGQYSVSTYFGTCESNELAVNVELNILNAGLSGISVYPNPTTDELNLVVSEQFIGKSYQIFSTNGALVKTGKIETIKTQFSVAGIAKGSYSIKIANLDQAIKFVKK